MHLKENLISNDSPFSAVDSLGREPLAKRVADFIQGSNLDDEGVTVSIEAPWGDGKSWMLSRIRAAFNGNPNYQVIAFSPWLVGSHEKLTLDFLNTLYAAFNKKTELQKAALAVAKYISGQQALLEKVALGIDASAGGVFAKCLVVPLVWVGKKFTSNNKPRESLPALYEQIRKSLREPRLPKTVVLIDDIDRLQPEEVAEVIRLIQSVGRLPNVVYVLAIEPNYVIEALKQIGHANATQFLDKIIQLRISLPRQRYSQLQQVIEETLNNAASSSLFTAFEANGYSLQADWQRYLRPLIAATDNLRDWKRVLNRFRFVEQGLRGQVNPVELLVLCAIAIKTPALYAKIVSSPHLFAHDVNNYDAHKLPSASDEMSLAIAAATTRTTPHEESLKQEQKYQQLQIELGLGDGHLVWRLVDGLFPKFKHPNYASRPNRATGQLQIYANLRLALSGDGLNEQLSNEEIHSVLFVPEQRQMVFDKVKTNRYLWDDLTFELDKQRYESHQFVQPESIITMIAESALKYETGDFFTLLNVDAFVRQWLDNILSKSGEAKAKKFIDNVVLNLRKSYSGNWALARTLREICSDEKDFKSHCYENLRKLPSDEQKTDWADDFGQWCIRELDKGALKNQPQAQVLFWSLAQISKEHFASIGLTQQRFSAWCDVMCQHRSGGSAQVNFHSASVEKINLLGGQNAVNELLALVPDHPAEMMSWKAALREPNKRFIVGTTQLFD